MRTRLVEVDDATAVMNIYNPEVNEASISFDLVPRTLAQQEEWIGRHLDTHPCIVAVNEDDDVGELGARVSEYWVSRSSRRFATARPTPRPSRTRSTSVERRAVAASVRCCCVS